MFGRHSLVGFVKLGEVVTKKRLKELATRYRLVIVIWREIHIVTNPLELNDQMYPDGSYRVEEIDVRGQWVEVRHLSTKDAPHSLRESSESHFLSR
jgi:hypothetical protein